MGAMESENAANPVEVWRRLAGVRVFDGKGIGATLREIYTSSTAAFRSNLDSIGSTAGGATRGIVRIADDIRAATPRHLSAEELGRRNSIVRSVRLRIESVKIEWGRYKLYCKQSKAELRIIADAFSNRLSQLSFDAIILQFLGDKKRRRRLKMVKWAELEYHPDQYRLQVDSLTLPRGRGINEMAMMKPDVLVSLSMTAQKPVAAHMQDGVGLWYLVDREHGIGNIPRYCDYATVREFASSKGKLGMAQIPIGFTGGRKLAILDFNDERTAHLIVGGTTGGGKSSLMHLLICHLIQYPPEQVRLALFDFKRVEFKPYYASVPHLMHEIVVDPTLFMDHIRAIRQEVERRYSIMDEAGVQHVRDYNARRALENRLPDIFVIVDELAVILMNPEMHKVDLDVIEADIGMIATQARACGIHLILCTQRPDARVLTSYIRACTPCKIAYACASSVESQVIIGTGHAAFRDQVPLGRAIMVKSKFEIPFQTAWIPKADRIRIAEAAGSVTPPGIARAPESETPDNAGPVLTETERRLVTWALEQNGGYLSLSDAMEIGKFSRGQAQRLCLQWEDRGWLIKDVYNRNKRRITSELATLISLPVY